MECIEGQLNTWDVFNVSSMQSMFYHALEYRVNINDWNVSKVTNMNGIFKGIRKFNNDLNKWDVGNVENMTRIFFSAVNFDQHLCWNVKKNCNIEYIFGNSPWILEKYQDCKKRKVGESMMSSREL